MRFRANIGKDKLGLVAAQCKVIGELSKTAMVQLSPGVFEVAVRLEEDALQVFSKLTTEGVFTSFDVKSANHDRIGLEVKMASLIHALKSCNEAPTLQIKLTKKAGIPYLSMTAMVRLGHAVRWIAHVAIRSHPHRPPPSLTPLPPELGRHAGHDSGGAGARVAHGGGGAVRGARCPPAAGA
jgi:HUS1 checkpoint protein